MAEKRLSFEAAMARLEIIVAQLEQGETPLEEALTLFEEGTKLMTQCGSLLDKAEQKVTKLVSSDNVAEAPFQVQAEEP